MGHGHEARLVEFLRALNRDPALPAVARTILEHALEILPQAQSATFLSLNDEEGVFEYQAAVGYDLGELSRLKLPRDRTIQHQLGLAGPAIIRDPQRLHRDLLPPAIARGLDAFPVAAFITFPILVEGEVIAYFNVNSRDDPDAFSPADLDRLQGVWEEITLAVRRAWERAELADSERRFRLLFERLVDAVYITSLDGTILEANPAAEKQTGYSRSELLGMNIMRDLAAEEPALTYARVNELLFRGETVYFEEKKRRKDGAVFITDCAVTLFEYKGKPATLSVNRDITRRKKAEENLSRRVAQLQALNRATYLIASKLELEDLLKEIVTSLKEATGADYATVTLFGEQGRPPAAFDSLDATPLPSRMRPRGMTAWIRKSGEALFIGEIREDGTTDPEVVWPDDGTSIRANPVLVQFGIRSLAGIPIKQGEKVTGVVYVHSRQPQAFQVQQDVLYALVNGIAVALENALLYREIREAQARYRTLFDASPVSLWLEDFSAIKAELDRLKEEGVEDLRAHLRQHPEFVDRCEGLLKVLEVNRKTLELYRVRDYEEFLAKFPELIPPEVRPLFEQELLAIWEGRRECSGEGVNRTADGKTLYIFLNWRVLPGHEESYGQVLVSIVDITARVEAEEALRAVNRSLAAIASTLELPALLRVIHDEARKLIPFDSFFVAQVDERRQELSVVFCLEAGEELEFPPLPLDPEASPTAWVAVNKKPLFLEDMESTPQPIRFIQVGQPVRGWAGVPLIAQGEVIGVLSVQSFAPLKFSEREKQTLLALASGAAAALRNAFLYNQVQTAAEKLRAIEAVSRQMKLATSKDELYKTVLDSIHQILGYQACAIIEAHEDRLEVVAERGYLAEARALRIPLSGEKGVTAAAFNSGNPVYVPDVAKDPRYLPGIAGAKCELALPILGGGRRFGVLNVEHDQLDGIPPEDHDLLGIIASELAVALAGLERLEQVEAVNERLAGLHRLVMRLSRCATVEEVCEVAAHEAVRILGFTTYTVSLVEGDWLVPKASVGIEGRPLRRGEGVAWQTLACGQRISGNLEDLPQARPVRPDLRSVLSVPIGDFGVFQVASTARDAFSPEDVLVAEILAGHLREEIRRIRIEEQLREQAIRDPLTGLYNRRTLGGVLEREIERAKRYEHPLTLVMADIDDFKSVNDRHGHLVGDALLRRVAEVLRGSVRAGDYVFRYGGEEFVLVLPETGDGEGVLPRLRQAVRGISLPDVPGLSVSLSVGHVVWSPVRDGPTTVEALLRRADEVLYGMKRRRIHKR